MKNKKRSNAANRVWKSLPMEAKIDRVARLNEGYKWYYDSLTEDEKRARVDKMLATRRMKKFEVKWGKLWYCDN